MPIAGKNIIKEILLPGYPADDPAKLKLIINPKASIMDDVDMVDAKLAEQQMLAKMIVEWNFTDESGKLLEINPENVKTSLSIFDIDFIHQTLGFTKTLTSPQKKS